MKVINESLMFDIAEYIKNYQARHGESPSRQEIADKFIIAVSKAHRYVLALQGRGMFELDDDGAIVVHYRYKPSKQMLAPIISHIACGSPTIAIEDYQGMLKLPIEFTGAGNVFVLIAKGDSMIDAGISAGDYLVIREQSTADSGDIVAACRISDFSSDEEATLKRYKWTSGGYVLHAENDSGKYEDMDASEYRIMGKLVSTVRKYEAEEVQD